MQKWSFLIVLHRQASIKKIEKGVASCSPATKSIPWAIKKRGRPALGACTVIVCTNSSQKVFLSPFSLDVFFRIPAAFPAWLWEISRSLILFFYSFHPPAAFISPCLPGHLKEMLIVFQTGLTEFDCEGVTSVLNQCTVKMEQSS